MNWNTTQVGKRLGLTTSCVRGLIERGLLIDHAPINPNHKRHAPKLNSTEVIAFSKTYKRKLHTETLKARMNGSVPPVKEAPVKPSAPPILQRIEAKLDQLIKMWQ